MWEDANLAISFVEELRIEEFDPASRLAIRQLRNGWRGRRTLRTSRWTRVSKRFSKMSVQRTPGPITRHHTLTQLRNRATPSAPSGPGGQIKVRMSLRNNGGSYLNTGCRCPDNGLMRNNAYLHCCVCRAAAVPRRLHGSAPCQVPQKVLYIFLSDEAGAL